MPRAPQSIERLRAWAPGLAAAGLALLLYAGTLGHALVYDDAFILKSPMLAHPWNLRALFSDGFYGGYDRYLGLYRPLGQWTLVLNAVAAKAFTGSFENPVLYHAVNVLLHALASFLVFAWLARLPLSPPPLARRVAGAAAILWAVHPVHAEVAANVTARYESLVAVFGLSFLIAHRARKGIAAAVLLLLALWCKESAIALLPLALAVDVVFPVEGRRFSAWAAVPSAAILAFWFPLRAHALSFEAAQPVPVVENITASAEAFERGLTAAKVQVLYLRDQLVPLWLASDHSFLDIELVESAFDPYVLAFVAIAAAALLAAWMLRRRMPAVALAVLGWTILFAPASNFLVPIGTLMNDRLAYLPSIFTCLLAAVFLSELPSRALGTIVLAASTVALCVASFAEARTWRDSLTLITEQVADSPRSVKAHKNLGDVFTAARRLPEAVREYKQAIAIYEPWPEHHLGLAYVYELLGEDPELVIVAWADGIRYGTTAPRPMRSRALGLIDLGRWDELARLRDEIVAGDPYNPFAVLLGRMLRAAQSQGTRPEAGSRPGAADPARADEHFRRGEWAEAEDAWRRALHRGKVPESEVPRVLLDLARCHDELGRPERGRWYRNLSEAVAAQRAKRGE